MSKHLARLVIRRRSGDAERNVCLITEPALNDRSVEHFGWSKQSGSRSRMQNDQWGSLAPITQHMADVMTGGDKKPVAADVEAGAYQFPSSAEVVT